MKFLVLGGTGTVGSQVVAELQKRKHKVRVLTRDAEKAKRLGDVEVLQGDLLDTATLHRMYEGVDGAFIVNTVSASESSEGLLAVTAAKVAKVPRLVYLSVQDADKAAHLPHFGSKIGVEEGLKRTGTEWTILRPSNFYQNDVWLKDVILQYGVYPQPLGSVGVSRVDVRDIAELAASALVDGGHAGKVYEMGGPRPLTGEDCAQVWSDALGRKISYGGDDLEAWEKANAAYLPALLLYDFKHMFHHFQTQGLKLSDADLATLTQALGHPPRSYEDYVAETAKAWTAEGAAAAR